MVRIVLTELGMVMGEQHTGNPGMICLKEPRALQMQPEVGADGQPTGQNTYKFLMLLGNPKGLEVGRDRLNYDVTDENLLRAYKECVTGLTLVGNSGGMGTIIRAH